MGIENYFLAPGANTALFPEGMAPSNVNDGMRTVQADMRTAYNDPVWIQYGKGDGTYTAAYAGAGSFTIADANVTAVYHANRRVRITGSLTGTLYGTIASSSYTDPNTTVVVTLDSGTLQSEALTVWLSAVPAVNTPLPGGVAVFGTAAAEDIGTSGANVPLLSTDNVWGGWQTLRVLRCRHEDDAYALFVSTDTGRLVLADASTGVDPWVNMIEWRLDTSPRRMSVLSEIRAENGLFIGSAQVTSVATSAFADNTAGAAGTSTTVVMNPATTKAAIDDGALMVANKTEISSGLAALDKLLLYLNGSGALRKLSLATLRTWLRAPDFEATGLALSGFPVTEAHGLAAEPRRVEALLRCTTADLGFSIGDAVDVMSDDTNDNGHGVTIGRNATSVWVSLPASGLRVRRRDTNAMGALTYGSWRIEMRAWA